MDLVSRQIRIHLAVFVTGFGLAVFARATAPAMFAQEAPGPSSTITGSQVAKPTNSKYMASNSQGAGQQFQGIPAPQPANLLQPGIANPELTPVPKPPVTTSSLTIPRLPHPPMLEDFLSMKPVGGVAEQMTEVSTFLQRNPHDGEAVSQRTSAYLGYDQKNLYVVFVCFDDPKKIRARMSRREDIYDDDQVEVMLDTFHDRRRAYAFQTTPLGVQWDAIWTEATRHEVNGNWDTSWDASWDSRGKLTEKGFIVWISIPFKSLRFPATREQVWGILLYRGIVRKNEDAFWPQVSYKVQSRLAQEGTMFGLQGISPGRDIELIPYGIMQGFRALDERDPYDPYFQNATLKGQTGMDAKFVLNDDFVLDLTANPDFSQVESEDPQITVNQRFEVYFPEKRPFFLENEDYFRTPIDLFFTRNIEDPSAGIRFTGKGGPYSLGFITTDDRAPGLAVPDFCPSTSPVCSSTLSGDRSYFTVARVSRDIWKQSNVGAIFSNWECPSTGEYNRVGGFDGRFKLSGNWTLEGQAVASSSTLLGLNAANLESTCEYNLYPFSSGNAGNGNHYAGPADRLEIRRNGLHFNYIGSYQDVSPGFVTVPGFVNRVDIRGMYNTVYYRFRPKKGWVLAWGPSLQQRYVFDHEGNRLDTYYDPYLKIEGRGQTLFYLSPYDELRERLRPQDFAFIDLAVNRNYDYHEHQSSAYFQTEYFKKFIVGAEYTWGNGANFVPAPHDLPQVLLSRQDTSRAILSFRPVKRLKIENEYLYERLRATNDEYVSAQAQAPGPIGKGIFNNDIVRSKWNWQFTPQLSLRVIMQYNSLLANTPGNVYYPYTYLPTEKEFNADFLVTYLVHPGTAVYVGYNSDLQNLNRNLMLDPTGQAGLYSPRGFINDSRQVFVKVSYLFRP